MLSKIPLNLEKIKKEDLDKEILRAGIIAELDAINLYEQMAAITGTRISGRFSWILRRRRKLMQGNSRLYC